MGPDPALLWLVRLWPLNTRLILGVPSGILSVLFQVHGRFIVGVGNNSGIARRGRDADRSTSPIAMRGGGGSRRGSMVEGGSSRGASTAVSASSPIGSTVRAKTSVSSRMSSPMRSLTSQAGEGGRRRRRSSVHGGVNMQPVPDTLISYLHGTLSARTTYDLSLSNFELIEWPLEAKVKNRERCGLGFRV
jgi:hypothetical protein